MKTTKMMFAGLVLSLFGGAVLADTILVDFEDVAVAGWHRKRGSGRIHCYLQWLHLRDRRYLGWPWKMALTDLTTAARICSRAASR